MKKREGGSHQICSFMWADNYWMMSHAAGADDEEVARGG